MHELALDALLQPLALPQGVVSILNRQRRQPRFAPLEGTVGDGQLAIKDGARPTVRNNVMPDAQEHVLLLAQPHKDAPQQRPVLMVESLGSPREQQAVQGPVLLVRRRRGMLKSIGCTSMNDSSCTHLRGSS